MSAHSGPWPAVSSLQRSFPKADIGEAVQHLSWMDGGNADEASFRCGCANGGCRIVRHG
ncbi:MAG: hypothetical protein ACI82I_002909 [Gammaproteobacteria bacterium]|jgi:hypothetical protein